MGFVYTLYPIIGYYGVRFTTILGKSKTNFSLGGKISLNPNVIPNPPRMPQLQRNIY
jgi:hypothetical protein